MDVLPDTLDVMSGGFGMMPGTLDDVMPGTLDDVMPE
jgi:hypothetical protein